MAATIVIRDANVITMESAAPTDRVDTIAIERDKIIAVGNASQIEALVAPNTVVFNLSGRTVLPGFIDTHVHFTQTGLGASGPSVHDATTADQVLHTIADAASCAVRDQPLLIHGYSTGTMDRRITSEELDRIAPQNPVLLSDVGGHSCVINKRSWQVINLDPRTEGVRINPTSGSPTGHLASNANKIAREYFYTGIDDTTREAALHLASEIYVRAGVTTVHALEGGSRDHSSFRDERDVEMLLTRQLDLSVRTVVYPQTTDVKRVLDLNLLRIGGCILVDGAYAEHTSALLEPYTDDPTTKGVLYFSDDALNAFVRHAHRAGLQISMHAIGDAAIEQLLNAYGHALHDDPRPDHRHRIEHFSLPAPNHVGKAADLGVALSMQPNYAAMPEEDKVVYQPAALRLLGEARYGRRHPYRRILDAGALVAGGSGSDSKPIGPLIGIHAVANHPDEERRLSVYEALALYTTNAAKIAFEEKEKGTIEPGKLADLVVLSDSPLTMPLKRIRDIRVEMTIMGGKVVYKANCL